MSIGRRGERQKGSKESTWPPHPLLPFPLFLVWMPRRSCHLAQLERRRKHRGGGEAANRGSPPQDSPHAREIRLDGARACDGGAERKRRGWQCRPKRETPIVRKSRPRRSSPRPLLRRPGSHEPDRRGGVRGPSHSQARRGAPNARAPAPDRRSGPVRTVRAAAHATRASIDGLRTGGNDGVEKSVHRRGRASNETPFTVQSVRLGNGGLPFPIRPCRRSH